MAVGRHYNSTSDHGYTLRHGRGRLPPRPGHGLPAHWTGRDEAYRWPPCCHGALILNQALAQTEVPFRSLCTSWIGRKVASVD